MSASPVLPDWNDGCVTQIVPGLLEPERLRPALRR